MKLGIRRSCRRCGKDFCLCQSCWHNQEYCSESCGDETRKQSHKVANRKYSKTDKGRGKNRERQKRHRSREKNEPTVTDQYSTKVEVDVKESDKSARDPHLCKNCGERIEHFVEELKNGLGVSKFRGQKCERSYFSFIRFR